MERTRRNDFCWLTRGILKADLKQHIRTIFEIHNDGDMDIDAMNKQNINDKFIKEYTSEESIKKYTKDHAGHGISYLLEHDYGELYLQVIEREIKDILNERGIRILEYGCGGGMNLIHIVRMIDAKGLTIDRADGTDFSPVLIEAANREAQIYLPQDLRKKVQFSVARNERLLEDLSLHTGKASDEYLHRYHLIVGVNTFRYGFRLKKEMESAQQICDLLMPGGVSIMIDMNEKFPFFRSKIRGYQDGASLETYIPSLAEYARPFKEVGLHVMQEKNFCWIHHSASRFQCAVLRTLSPLLQVFFQDYAMRSLVIARKGENE